jgi:hypothetical protein
MFCPISVDYVILSFHHAHGPAQGLGGAHSELWDANSPEDVARWEVNHAANEKAHTHTKRERNNKPGAPLAGWRRSRSWTPPRSRFSGEGEEEGELTPPSLSSLCRTPPPLCDIVSR